MALTVFNTLSRRLEEFQPRDESGEVGMYCCGPTVHNFAHIGNFRTFVFADLVRRYLEFKGYRVRHVMNVTDVEDKIIAAVRASGRSLSEYTGEFQRAFFEDFRALGCAEPTLVPRATDHIAAIVELIRRLEERGFAYRAGDGSVYFSIENYRRAGHEYGQLLTLNFEGMRAGERVARDEYEKESVADFALWKARVPEDGDVFWPSPWGEGRPGWHIECSAMSMKLLGPSFDLHIGGEDLVFPHHEDEIAQSEGAELQGPGCRFVRYWLHASHLLVEGKKMSKSLGNFFTLRDLLGKGFAGREIRFLLLSAHYRGLFNFTLENLSGARTSLARLDECLEKLRELAGSTQSEASEDLLRSFEEAMDHDFNVSAGWGHLFEWVREANRAMAAGEVSKEKAAAWLAAWDRIDRVFNVGKREATEAPPEILELLEKRLVARKAKDFAASDAIRDQLKSAGWLVEDTPKGPRLKRLSS